MKGYKTKDKKKGAASTALGINKKKMLAALEKSLGVVTQAAKIAGLNRTDHYNYMKSDPKYAAAVAELENISLDFAESKLYEEINSRNITAIIFFL